MAAKENFIISKVTVEGLRAIRNAVDLAFSSKERKRKEEEAQAERLRLDAEQQANKTRGVKYLWKFELVDKTKLSEDWITMDESAVKEFLKAKKDTLKDGEVISGVRFYKDQSVST